MGTIHLLLSRFVVRGIQGYWRLTRGSSLGVEACLVDGDNQVLLVKNADGGGWRLPAGVVRKGETLKAALRRSLRDECGIDVGDAPRLFWVYAEDSDAASKKTGFFIVRQWRYSTGSASAETALFKRDALPAPITQRAAARIGQALEGRAPTEVC